MSHDIEKLKAYHHIESFLDGNTKNLLLEQLDLKNAHLEKRLPGLRVEDEFALILFFLNNCKHIVSVDETTSVLTQNSYQSDYILQFKNNEKILVEIKSTSNDKYKISKNNYDKKREFAKDMGLELYFALKINGSWSLFTSDYLASKNYKINYSDHINNSILFQKLDSIIFIIPKGIKAESIYSKNKAKDIGIEHDEFGTLISYKLFFNDKLIIEVLPNKKDYLSHCIVIELWHDVMSQNLTTETINCTTTKVIEISNENFRTCDFQYFLSSIQHIVDENYNKYHPTSFLKSIASGNESVLSKKILFAILEDLKKLGIPIKVINCK